MKNEPGWRQLIAENKKVSMKNDSAKYVLVSGMKTLRFTVTVEELADNARDYRVAGAVCYAVTRELRGQYGKQINVVVNPEPATVQRENGRPA